MDVVVNGNNLYRNGRVIEFSNGEKLLLRDPIEIKGTTEDIYYTLKEFDRLDLLAYKFYKDYVPDASKFWWVIADANIIINPLDLTEFVGREILIPNILNVLLRLE